MSTEITSALQQCRDAARDFADAIDRHTAGRGAVDPDSLSQVEQRWGLLSSARQAYEQALVAAGNDRPNI